MRRLILCALTAFFSVAAPALAQTVAGGQPSCAAGDPVVWANSSSKVYHLQGDKYYGNTKHGQYLCRSKADAAGYHASKSGNVKSTTQGSPAAGTASPLPGASPSAKHHHHHKASASPAPSAT